MRPMTLIAGLVTVLAGALPLGGCTTVDYDDYWVARGPIYGRGVYIDDYRYRNPDGLVVVYDPGPSLYSVVSVPGLYWHEGYYYRRHGERWERSRYHRGPWAIYRQPPRVVPRHEPTVVRRTPSRQPYVVPERYREWERARPVPEGERVGRYPRPQPNPSPSWDPERRRVVQAPPGPQNIPYVRRPDPNGGLYSPGVPARRQQVERSAPHRTPVGGNGPQPAPVGPTPDRTPRGSAPQDQRQSRWAANPGPRPGVPAAAPRPGSVPDGVPGTRRPTQGDVGARYRQRDYDSAPSGSDPGSSWEQRGGLRAQPDRASF